MSQNSGIVLACTAAFAANAPIATVISASMQTSPLVTAVTELQVPLTENWVLSDMYVLSAAGAGTPTVIDPVITLDKNRGRQLVESPPLSAMLITSNTRPRFSPNPIGFEGGSIIRSFAISRVLNGGAISTATYFIAVSIM